MDTLVGKVTHYFDRIGVAVLDLTAELKVGDHILILGRTTDIAQPVSSMEIDHHQVQSARPGMDVALLVADPVRVGDKVYKVVEVLIFPGPHPPFIVNPHRSISASISHPLVRAWPDLACRGIIKLTFSLLLEKRASMEIEYFLQSKREEILLAAARRGATNVRVFGSAVSGDFKPDSDIDFLVELEPGRKRLRPGGAVNGLTRSFLGVMWMWSPKKPYPLVYPQ